MFKSYDKAIHPHAPMDRACQKREHPYRKLESTHARRWKAMASVALGTPGFQSSIFLVYSRKATSAQTFSRRRTRGKTCKTCLHQSVRVGNKKYRICVDVAVVSSWAVVHNCRCSKVHLYSVNKFGGAIFQKTSPVHAIMGL